MGRARYLIVDMPPGKVMFYHLHVSSGPGCGLVTHSQDVAVADVRRALRMFETVAIPVLGVVKTEYFIALIPARVTTFSEKAGRAMSQITMCLFSDDTLGMEVPRVR